MRIIIPFYLLILSVFVSADGTLQDMIKKYESQINSGHLDDQNLAFLSHEIGQQLMQAKEYKSAIKYFKTALEIDQKIDPNDPLLGGRWTYLGQAYTFDGQFDNGIDALNHALIIDKRHYPIGHLNIGISHGNLGWALIRSRNYKSANDNLKVACAIFLKELGAENPQTLDCQKKLSVTLKYL